MKKQSKMQQLREMTEQDLLNLTKNELVELLASVSKTLRQNIRKLESSGYADVSQFLRRVMTGEASIPVELKRKALENMTITDLRKELRRRARVARLKTSTVSGTKKMMKEFKRTTGKDITDLSSLDWERIRKAIEEGYESDTAIKAYDASLTDEEYYAKMDELEALKIASEFEANADLSNEDVFDVLKNELKD